MTFVELAPSPPTQGQTPQQAVDAIAAGAKSSFSVGMKLLSRGRRQAMRAVYAYCRVLDDIADGDLDPSEKSDLLAAWRAEVKAVYAGQARSAIGQALTGPIAEFHLPEEEFLLIADGMQIDADGPVIAPEMDALLAYCRRVAGAVGLLSMRIFGAWRGEVSERFALTLANALQQTNILRDVEEDAALGRIYLPSECLEAAGVPPDPAAIAAHPSLPVARSLLAVPTLAAFQEARALIPAHDRAALFPALAMMGVYRAYFDRMEGADWRYGPTFRMGRWTKLRHGLGAVLAG